MIFKFHKSKRRSPPILQIDIEDLPKPVEEVFNVLGPNVGGQIPHVHSALAVPSTRRHCLLILVVNDDAETGLAD